MMSLPTASLRRNVLLCGCTLAALGWIAVGTANAQPAGTAKANASPAIATAANQNSSLDLGGSAAGPAPPAAATAANRNSELDMGAGGASTAAAPVAAAAMPAPAQQGAAAKVSAAAVPTAAATVSANALPSRGNVQDGLDLGIANSGAATQSSPKGPPVGPPMGQPAGQIATAQPPLPAPASTSGAPPPAQVEPISLDHPTVVDTDTLKSGDVTVSLYGIQGIPGEAAEGMQGFLAANTGRVTCQAENTAGFVCLLPDGTDVAEVALVNGAARVKDDAPAAYQAQQAAAEAARRGIWANLPPPPATIKHPAVQDTATLVSDGQTYRLDGIVGLGTPYSQQLQGYIQANGDAVTCMPQGPGGYYICTLPDGTDLARVALVNGAARVAPDAPDAYRTQQGLALNAHRGFWLNPPSDVLLAMSTVQAAPVCCAYAAGDEGIDGVTYVDGVPEAVIDGAAVFMVYAGALGWGYYDHYHHWHDAPDRFRRHLDHFHPDGHGLRGYGHEEALRRDTVLRDNAARRGATLHHDVVMHNEALRGGVARPGFGGGFHPGVAGGFRPGMAGGFRPGMAGGFHPAGGFVHPGPSLGGFHPGAAPAAHMASVAHVGGRRK